ncbi:MAG: iron transporter [Natronomonas sp.]
MDRRKYLEACLTASAIGVAGCLDGVETREIPSTPPILEDRPVGVYFPTHVDGMKPIGTSATDEYAVGLFYTFPHRFWRVDATTSRPEEATFHDVDGSQDAHLMVLLWDPETETTLPESGVTLEIERDGQSIEEGVVYPMLSAQMGFHYGANFRLDGDGEYDITVAIGGTTVRRTGAYQGRFGDPETVSFSFSFSAAERAEISFERTADRAGDPDVPPVMDMDMPLGVGTPIADLPGDVRGTATSGDAQLVVTTLEPPAGIGGDGTYIAVSARTPYNDLVLPTMALEGRLQRDGASVVEAELQRTFDERLGYHYGMVVDDVMDGDELTIDVLTHPQVARHEGYETAFLDMPSASLVL